MRKLIPFLLGAAVIAPLYLSTPALAQSLDQIHELEERVQEAKQRGNWGYARQLNVQLNMMRLQYQKRHGLPEYSDRSSPYYQQNNQYNSGRYYPNHRSRYQQRGYYDRWGNWRSY